MKHQRAKVIDPNGDVRLVDPLDGKKFTLKELQSFVGGYIELVHLPRGNGRVTAYVNETGKLDGLLYNAEASAIYGREPADVVVGPLVIVSTVDEP